jgi:hypothetical protein
MEIASPTSPKTRASSLFPGLHTILGCVWLFLVVLDVASIAKNHQPPQFTDAAIFAAALLCVGIERSSTRLLAVLALPFIALAIWLHFPFFTSLLLALGFGGVLALAWFAFKGSLIAQQNLLVALIMLDVPLLMGDANSFIAHITPITFDAQLLRFDRGLSTAIYMWALQHSWRSLAAYAIYVSLPAAVALAIRVTLGRARLHLLLALCLAPALAALCFLILPAVGPAHVGQPHAWRNCMPSLHLSWALLLWLSAGPRWWKAVSFAFVLVTVYATLATGEHYWIDLVAAVPFSLLVQWLTEPGAARQSRPEQGGPELAAKA